jgi:RHS repeat-associated protein
MTSATVNSVTTTFTYRGDGLRNSRTTGGVTTGFTWDVNRGLPVVLDDGNQYVYGAGLASMVTGTGTYYYLADGLGSTMAIVDSSGAVQKSYTYDVYGKPTATGTLANEFDFAGQDTDPSTGLQYLRARYMDPATGRFTSRDPMASGRTLRSHPFAYGDQNPITNIDPTGQVCWGPLCIDKDGPSVGGHEVANAAKAVLDRLEDLGTWTADQIARHPTLFVSLLQTAVGSLATIACAAVETGVGAVACGGLILLYLGLAEIKLDLIKGEYEQGKISKAEAKCREIMDAPWPFPFGQIGQGICANIHVLDQVKERF